LLRVLQEREVTPVGSSIPVPVNVQVIAATNRNLEEEVAKGRFREDLYYRLNMVELSVPALRERPEDIPSFIEFFAQKFAHRYNRSVWHPDDAILREFVEYNWPGNVRQLAHVIEQAYVLETTPSLPSSEQKSLDMNLRLPYLNLDKLRYEAVRQALTTTQGHKGRAAQLLGVHANTLTRMLSEFKMTPSQWNTAIAGTATVSAN
jgi:DNA-binding NtrC family response regulator